LLKEENRNLLAENEENIKFKDKFFKFREQKNKELETMSDELVEVKQKLEKSIRNK